MAGKKAGFAANVFVLVVFGAGLWGCMALMKPTERTPAEQEAYKFEMAMIRCENATKDRIANAEGIRFSPYSEWRALPDEQGDGLTLSYEVVAKNAFGALVPARMRCHATYDGARWTADEITQE
jgi:hypothetical protein